LQEICTDDIGGPELNLNRIVAKAEDYGLNMHYHTQGDLAIEAVLTALDKVVAKNGKLKGIHTLAHCAFPTDAEIAHINKFNGQVVATMQPGFWPVESNTAYYYGERATKAYPLRKMMESGVSVGFSTDFAVSPLEYCPAMAVLGIAVTGSGQPKVHQPITIKQAIQALSIGSARTTGKNDVGTLDIGKKADLVVLEKDLYSIKPEDISAKHPRVLATYVNGRQMYPTGK
jgi:predicted amidohydrolase YtcJ